MIQATFLQLQHGQVYLATRLKPAGRLFVFLLAFKDITKFRSRLHWCGAHLPTDAGHWDRAMLCEDCDMGVWINEVWPQMDGLYIMDKPKNRMDDWAPPIYGNLHMLEWCLFLNNTYSTHGSALPLWETQTHYWRVKFLQGIDYKTRFFCHQTRCLVMFTFVQVMQFGWLCCRSWFGYCWKVKTLRVPLSWENKQWEFPSLIIFL